MVHSKNLFVERDSFPEREYVLVISLLYVAGAAQFFLMLCTEMENLQYFATQEVSQERFCSSDHSNGMFISNAYSAAKESAGTDRVRLSHPKKTS